MYKFYSSFHSSIIDTLQLCLKRVYFIEESLGKQLVAAFRPYLLRNEMPQYDCIGYLGSQMEDCNRDPSPSLDDHILWAVPKKRRTVEKRRSRRIGAQDYVCKLIPYKKLLTCLVCGNPHEVGKLCPNCYSKVMKVTESIKKVMINADGLKPVEHDFEPVFEGEQVESKDGFYNGKRIIEIPEERPAWFAKKLTQKSNVSISDERSPAISNPLHIK